MRKLIIVLFMSMFLISLASGDVGVLGFFKQGEDLNLSQSCDDCTFNNITKVLYPNGTTALYNATMQSDGSGTYYYYTLSKNYTKTMGVYSVYGKGDDSSGANWNYEFNINPMGVELTTPRSIIYIILFVVFLFLFILDVVLITKLPHSNPTVEGHIISISYLKYLKSVLLVGAWGLVISILLISSSLANSYLGEQGISNLLFNMFKVLTSWQLIIAGLLIWLVWLFFKAIRDMKIKGVLDRGFYPNERGK